MNINDNQILIGHGSGGKLTHHLINELFAKQFSNEILNRSTDAALFGIDQNIMAITTDSYVVDPIFFPGGDIGKLAVCGTVNDLAVSGAIPLYLTSSFIIEEGFSMEKLTKIVESMAITAKEAGVQIIAGDTKVVNKGKADKLFINTTGIGSVHHQHRHISTGSQVKEGDIIIINGKLGEHGIAILAARESLSFQNRLLSDCAPLNGLIRSLLDSVSGIKFMRDLTRGGLATCLCELASMTGTAIQIDESKIPQNELVTGACELFGFDPLYLANEGKMLLVVSPDKAEFVVELMKKHPLGVESAIVGEVTMGKAGRVSMKTITGGHRIIDMLSGEMLPRIC